MDDRAMIAPELLERHKKLTLELLGYGQLVSDDWIEQAAAFVAAASVLIQRSTDAARAPGVLADLVNMELAHLIVARAQSRGDGA